MDNKHKKLTPKDRDLIALKYAHDKGVRRIARELGRSPSTTPVPLAMNSNVTAAEIAMWLSGPRL